MNELGILHTRATRDAEVRIFAYARASRDKTAWVLTVPFCPFCRKRHTHGGGALADGQPQGGWKVSHCLTAERRQYFLVITEREAA